MRNSEIFGEKVKKLAPKKPDSGLITNTRKSIQIAWSKINSVNSPHPNHFHLLLQSFRHFTHVTAHSQTLSMLHLHHSSFSNSSIASPMSQLILQPFRCFTYITAHSSTLPLLHLCHSSFYNPFDASPTSQLILQPFYCFTYVTGTWPTLQLILQPFCCFTYITWQAAHVVVLFYYLRSSSKPYLVNVKIVLC